jgi:hypothetical protein
MVRRFFWQGFDLDQDCTILPFIDMSSSLLHALRQAQDARTMKLKILVGTMTSTADYVAQAIQMDCADLVDDIEVQLMDGLDISASTTRMRFTSSAVPPTAPATSPTTPARCTTRWTPIPSSSATCATASSRWATAPTCRPSASAARSSTSACKAWARTASARSGATTPARHHARGRRHRVVPPVADAGAGDAEKRIVRPDRLSSRARPASSAMPGMTTGLDCGSSPQ